MKVNIFSVVMILGVIFTSLSLTSCYKDDYGVFETCPYCLSNHYHNWDDCRNRDRDNQNNADLVIISVGHGAATVTSANAEGTSLGYMSWIITGKQGFPNTDKKNEIGVNISLPNGSGTIHVADFNLHNGKSEVTRRQLGTNRSGDITLIDSVLVHTIRYDAFKVDFELGYQVPVYNDGRNFRVMPYHRITNIVDKGYTTTDLPNSTESGILYACKVYRHTLSVTVDGVAYDVHYTAILKRLLGDVNSNTVISSRLLSSGTSNVRNSAQKTTYTSSIVVERRLANGQTEQRTFEVEMQGDMSIASIGAQTVYYSGVTKTTAGYNTADDHVLMVPRDRHVMQHYVERKYRVQYNHFHININVNHTEAVYDDGINVFRFPHISYGNINDSFTFVRTSTQSAFDTYKFTQNVNSNFGSYNQRASESFDVVVIK